MKLFSKIRALFKLNGKEEIIELESAEVKQGVVYLHPLHDKDHTLRIKTDAVDLILNPSGEISEDDIWVKDNDKAGNKNKDKEKSSGSGKRSSDNSSPRLPKASPVPSDKNTFPFQKRKFTFMVYEDEYEALTDYLKSNGYTRAEYFLACLTATKKKSMDSTYKDIANERKKRRAEEKAQIKAASVN